MADFNELPISNDPSLEPIDNAPLKNTDDILDIAPNQVPERKYNEVVNLSEARGVVNRGDEITHVTNQITNNSISNPTSAAGSTGQIQFNTSGNFDANSNLTFGITGSGNYVLTINGIFKLGDSQGGLAEITTTNAATNSELNGEPIQILAANGDNNFASEGGNVFIKAGAGNFGNAFGSNINVDSGQADGSGGNLTLQGGSTNVNGSNGGSIQITPGTGTGAGIQGNVQINGAIATSAVGGHLIIPTCAGTPTGAATAGSLILDSTNNKVYVRSGGNWVALN